MSKSIKRISFQDLVHKVTRKDKDNTFSLFHPFNNKVGTPNVIDFTNSPINILLLFCRYFGIFWNTSNEIISNLFSTYNIIIIFLHLFYCIALIQSIFSSNPSFIIQSTIPLYSAKIQLVSSILSLWLLIRNRSLSSRLLAESIDCLAGDPSFTKRKKKMLRYFSIISSIFSIGLPFILVLIHLIISYTESIKNASALKCGSICVIIESISLFLISTWSFLSTSLLATLLISNHVESSQLVRDINKCTGGSQVDSLIFRHQTLERVIMGVENVLSSTLLILPILSSISIFFTWKFIMHDYRPDNLPLLIPSILSFITIIISTISLILLSSSLNGQLSLFRGVTRRLVYLQQSVFAPTQMIRLLLFTLRLTDNRLVLTAGSICTVNRQNLLIASLIIVIIGVGILSIRDGCIRVI